MAASSTLLEGIRWETYERLLDEVENPTRLTFDRGRLEIVSPSHRHETWTRLVDALIGLLAMELGVRLNLGGATTLRRRALERGMEPDACYWIANVAAVQGREDLDFDVDPVPDLVLEAEASRSVLDRLAILAELGVGEVWRFDGRDLVVLSLEATGSYLEVPQSRCFPWLPMDGVTALLAHQGDGDHTAWLLRARAWVREVVRPLFDRRDDT